MGEPTDTRTCVVCGAPVADVLRGYMGSVKACEKHLHEWNESREKWSAALASVRHGLSMAGAFEKWAADARDADGR